MTRHGLVQACLLLLFSTVPTALRADSEWIHHDLSIQLDPVGGNLAVTDRITLPEGRTELPPEFVLNGALEITASDPPLKRVPLGESGGFSGINSGGDVSGEAEPVRYRVQGSPSDGVLEITYTGPFNFGLSDQKEEYTRGFRETTGIIGPEGVYLSGAGYWYPYFDDRLIEFDMVVEKPQQWKIISQGNGTPTGADGRARWTSAGPMDEIYVVGGPLTLYEEAAGAVQAQVYLREPDEALAAKYLTATAQYVEMYRSLIGPIPTASSLWSRTSGRPATACRRSRCWAPKVIRFPFILHSSYPHEILHNWWGNSVFVDYASGQLGEGLTAYLADHLIKEQRGQGGSTGARRCRSTATTSRMSSDFPLTEFRARHSAATEAVGYGKTLMVFHMLRRELGDDSFRSGLARLYRGQRGKRASFDDLETVFETAGDRDLSQFFSQWTERAGAPALALEIAGVEESNDSYRVRGSLSQVQAGEPFALNVPLVVQTSSGSSTTSIRLEGAKTSFSIGSEEPPLALQVDPQFDLFRLLDPKETPSSIGQIFGAREIVAVLPAGASEEELEAYSGLMEGWRSDSHAIEIVSDDEIETLPLDRSVWLLGKRNRFARIFGDSSPEMRLTEGSVSFAGESATFSDHSIVAVRRHPLVDDLAIGWLAVDPVVAFEGMGRKLPHYGKYSYLAFEGDEPTNVIKGQWSSSESPLYVDLRAMEERTETLAAMPLEDRQALAELPPVFSEKALARHVAFLAAPDLEGRGVGGEGIQAAAEYIAAAFEAMGLLPGGEEGSYFQRLTVDPGPAGKPVETVNIVGYLAGANAAWSEQSTIVGAHYDHLGRGWPDVHSGDEGEIHPGADDNASGVAVLLELARNLAEKAAAGGPPQRNTVFVAFSGEEAKRSGSRHFVGKPTPFPFSGIHSIVNLDTVGRLFDGKVSVLGTGTADEWQHIFRGAGFVTGVQSRNVPGSAEASDQMSFIERGIPGVQIFTSAHEDYHRPSDTADKIDVPGLVKVATFVKEAVVYLGEREEPLTITIAKQEASASTAGPESSGSAGRQARSVRNRSRLQFPWTGSSGRRGVGRITSGCGRGATRRYSCSNRRSRDRRPAWLLRGAQEPRARTDRVGDPDSSRLGGELEVTVEER